MTTAAEREQLEHAASQSKKKIRRWILPTFLPLASWVGGSCAQAAAVPRRRRAGGPGPGVAGHHVPSSSSVTHDDSGVAGVVRHFEGALGRLRLSHRSIRVRIRVA